MDHSHRFCEAIEKSTGEQENCRKHKSRSVHKHHGAYYCFVAWNEIKMVNSDTHNAIHASLLIFTVIMAGNGDEDMEHFCQAPASPKSHNYSKELPYQLHILSKRFCVKMACITLKKRKKVAKKMAY